jgi:hypothetical protein
MNCRLPIVIALFLAAASLRAVAQESVGPEKLDFDSFKIIGQKNIFDPTRTGRRRPQAAPRLVERVSLVGTSVDAGDEAAFFTGSGVPDKPLKVGDSVKELKIVQITENGVRLTGPTNTFVLDFDNRRSLRRELNGPWQGSTDTSDPAPTAASGNSDDAASPAVASATPSSGGASDSVIERLRKRKLEEK